MCKPLLRGPSTRVNHYRFRGRVVRGRAVHVGSINIRVDSINIRVNSINIRVDIINIRVDSIDIRL